MTWQEVIEHPSLRDLPFKIELDAWGRIVMSPASNLHGKRQILIGRHLEDALSEGDWYVECSIETPKGTKVADVVWASEAFFERYGYQTPYPEAPEVCVEVMSPSNTQPEMEEKILLYLAKGAREVWLCDEDGRMHFFNHRGELPQSILAPGFPPQI